MLELLIQRQDLNSQNSIRKKPKNLDKASLGTIKSKPNESKIPRNHPKLNANRLKKAVEDITEGVENGRGGIKGQLNI